MTRSITLDADSSVTSILACDEVPIQTDVSAQRSLWGVIPVAPIHLGMDRLVVQQLALVRAGYKHTVILADHQAAFGGRLSENEAALRAEYYRAWFEHSCGLTAEYVLSSELHDTSEYSRAIFEIAARTPVNHARDALPRRRSDTPVMMVDALMILMQCVDPLVLRTDLVFADEGQRKIYSAVPDLTADVPTKPASLELPSVYIYSPLSSDITGQPLRLSTRETRISVHDNASVINRKVARMIAPPGRQPLPSGRVNALLEHFRWSVFPWLDEECVRVSCKTGRRIYTQMTDLEVDYLREELHPADLKECLVEALVTRLKRATDRIPVQLTSWIKPHPDQ